MKRAGFSFIEKLFKRKYWRNDYSPFHPPSGKISHRYTDCVTIAKTVIPNVCEESYNAEFIEIKISPQHSWTIGFASK